MMYYSVMTQANSEKEIPGATINFGPPRFHVSACFEEQGITQ